MNKKHIWELNTQEIIQGYTESNLTYTCNNCDKTYTKGRVYTLDDQLYDAYGAIKQHIRLDHHSVTDTLLNMDHTLFGLSEIQHSITSLIAKGKSDKEISEIIGIASSTVRSHRFKLREKEKQAKMYLALMESIRTAAPVAIEDTGNGKLESVHASAKMIDERYNITDKDREKVIKTYMDDKGGLKQFPPKAKKKIIILREIIKNFKPNTEYNEQEVNRILKRIYDDFPFIRRSLIEYGFMDRSKDGSIYRVKE